MRCVPSITPSFATRVKEGEGLKWACTRRYLFLDECGVGQCLGDLWVVALHADRLPAGVRDSKRARVSDYKEKDRLIASAEVGYRYVRVTQAEIDAFNVKDLITGAQVALIQGFEGEHVYVDCHLTDPLKLRSRLPKVSVTVAHRLDTLCSGVALASLVAYGLRTHELRALELQVGCSVGSGNLTDPITKAYLLSGGTTGLRKKWSLKSLYRRS